jgi:hypothetical protein
MKQEDIIRMAEEAGWNDGGDYINIEQFAALVAAAERELVLAAAIDGAEHAARKAVIDEREACAKVCDEADKYNRHISREIAGAIRARGQA